MNNFSFDFKELEKNYINEQRRVPLKSVLKVFYGITLEKKYRIAFVSTIKPYELQSTNEIKVTQGMESENVFWTCFDLLNNDALDIFCIFCNSLTEAILNVSDEYDALSAIKDRFYSWKLLLKNKGKMAYEAYQGLYGELYFLSEYLSKNRDIDLVVNAWVGPDGYSKDFSIDDTWYEIKTIGTSSTTVKINSLAQLDSEVDGHMVTIMVERMSNEYNVGICSVPLLYNSILNRIKSHQTRLDFINKVLRYGFIDDDSTINNYKFEMKCISFYKVNNKFPKLTKENIQTSSIIDVKYEILLASLEEFLEDVK